MKPSELYQSLMDELKRLTDLPEASILQSNLEECADARSVLVHALAQYLTDTQIATLIGRTRQGVNFIRMGWDSRRDKWTVKSNWKAISKYIASNDFQSK